MNFLQSADGVTAVLDWLWPVVWLELAQISLWFPKLKRHLSVICGRIFGTFLWGRFRLQLYVRRERRVYFDLTDIISADWGTDSDPAAHWTLLQTPQIPPWVSAQHGAAKTSTSWSQSGEESQPAV